jgi:Uma2 family endonuclease
VAAPQQEEAPGLLDHSEPWTEQEWLGLPEKSPVELVDGALVMSPRGSNQHQRLAYRSFAALDAAAVPTWSVVGEPTIRVGRNRLLMPDVAVIRGDLDPETVVTDAVDVGLVVEVVSPGNAAHDRILKPHLYAEAGIRWYLRVEQEGPVGHLHELVDGAYREIARGPVVELAEPFPATLDLPHLAR